MKNLFFISLLICFSVKGISQNYVSDPTFTNSSSRVWIGKGTDIKFDAKDSHTADGSGSYVVGTNFNAEIKQTIKAAVTPSGENKYTLKYWVKGTAGDKVQSSAFNNGTSNKGTLYTIKSTDTWELVEEVFTFETTKSGVTLKLILKKKKRSVKFDDVSLELVK